MKNHRLLIFTSTDRFFLSHRLPSARAALAAGFNITIMTRILGNSELLSREGFHVIPINLARTGGNPFKEIKTIIEIFQIYRKEKPDIVHQVAMKPILYGSLAARLAQVPIIINAFSGLGYLFISEKIKIKLLRYLILRFCRWLFDRHGCRLILQNEDDFDLLNKAKVIQRHNVDIVPGSGVDPEEFTRVPEPNEPALVVLPSRMLWDKGIGEFVAAARYLKGNGSTARFILVGDIDYENPASISQKEIEKWTEQGIVEWWGHQNEMPQIFSQSNLVCLPSYREGFPKSLLEAASCARAIVTTDVPGCRDIVKHQVNGLLVPSRDWKSLADAIDVLLESPASRTSMGKRGRDMAKTNFSTEIISRQILEIYQKAQHQQQGQLDT